jgi:hypothetical protein
VGYDISPLSRAKLINLTTRLTACVKFNSLEWRNIVTHGQLKENLYISASSKVINSILLKGKIQITHKIQHNISCFFFVMIVSFIDIGGSANHHSLRRV